MSGATHTGSRIREKRTDLGIKQGDLATRVGISAAYLNLIEHNRRRIGGKLLLDLASELGVDAGVLSEGAHGALIVALNDAASLAQPPAAKPERERIDDMANRYPGWSELIAVQHRRVGTLERTVKSLTDRLTHDPFLSTALHEVLSTVTAIRSTSGILVNGGEIEPEWQARFQRNLYEDSQRLADSARALVAYLDEGADKDQSMSAPQDEFDAWLEANAYAPDLPIHFDPADFNRADFNRAGVIPAGNVKPVPVSAPELQSKPARVMAAAFVARAAGDHAAIPSDRLRAHIDQNGYDPIAVASAFGVNLDVALRRLGTLTTRDEPGKDGPRTAKSGPRGNPFGLVICDGSGTMTFRKQTEGFVVPRYGAACPIWPLFSALNQPMVPHRARIRQAGRDALTYLAYSIALPIGQGRYDRPAVYEATMLLIPQNGPDGQAHGDAGMMPAGPDLAVGPGCRICPRTDCDVRRETSILSEGI